MQAHRLMRQNDTGSVVKVFGWALTRNGWEYFILEPKGTRRPTAIVMGFETEMGSVDLQEIKPYVVAFAAEHDLQDLAPCAGWEWLS